MIIHGSFVAHSSANGGGLSCKWQAGLPFSDAAELELNKKHWSSPHELVIINR
jgi:hypothetical protein